MKIWSTIFFCSVGLLVFAQEPHDKPDHPRGNNSNDQYLALPFYNEACELYANGQIQRAKRALYESINTSFALTEAQLFMAKILYEENKIDSAFLYFNSGIDFAVEQDPHHFFYQFETGMIMEEYGWVKHAYKHFKKQYGNVGNGKYEEDYPFTVDDFEKYERSLEMVYNYEFWIPKGHLIDTVKSGSTELFESFGNDILYYCEEGAYLLKEKKDKFKKIKKYKFSFAGIEDVSISESGEYMFYSKGNTAERKIYYRQKNGKKWGDEQELPKEVNAEGWNGDPFFNEEYSTLYFSTDRNGSKDLFLAKLDLENNKCLVLRELEIMNTRYDEINPSFNGSTFYFSSNGHATFGGYDLYSTEDNRISDGILVPTTVRNMGKPYNSNKNEMDIVFLANDEHLVYRTDYKDDSWHLRFKSVLPEEKISFDIKIVPLSVKDVE